MYKIGDLESILAKEKENERAREDTRISRINDSMMSLNTIKERMHDAQCVMGIKRDKNEDPELRKCRKEAIKSLKKEKREFKKTLKEE